jgi:hypothetical protein
LSWADLQWVVHGSPRTWMVGENLRYHTIKAFK